MSVSTNCTQIYDHLNSETDALSHEISGFPVGSKQRPLKQKDLL